MNIEVLGGLLSFVASALGCWLIVSTRRMHAHLSLDATIGGPQKFNPRAVPRVGGVAILAGLLAAAGILSLTGSLDAKTTTLLAIAGLPAFAGGLLEDLTKRISVSLRLRVTFLSAAIAFFLLDARIAAIDLPFVDVLLATFFGSFIFTLFAVGGLAHAMNIIDGFNGLFGVCALLALAAVAAVAAQVGDTAIVAAALIIAGAVLGFLMFNYPKAQLFAGDSGAYLVGFLVAELTVLLIHRNSEVSPWFALTLLAYPVFETFFSMYRKRILRGRSVGQPDGLHLHMLIYRRVVRWHPTSSAEDQKLKRNALTSPYLWILCALGVAAALVFWSNTAALQASAAAFAATYLWLYRSIVRFRVPAVLMVKSRRESAAADSAGMVEDLAEGSGPGVTP